MIPCAKKLRILGNTYGNSNRIVMILFTFSSFSPPFFLDEKTEESSVEGTCFSGSSIPKLFPQRGLSCNLRVFV